MSRKLRQIILGGIILIANCIFAQRYPVQVTSQMIPPYSLRLSDFNNSTSEKIVVNLLMNDLNEFNTQVGLRMYITNGQGLSIKSTDVVSGAPTIFLQGGIPLRLTNLDLQAYFQIENLQNISPQLYSQPLPDGMYQFCFEVYHWLSGRVISSKQVSCATAYLALNDPPFLNYPYTGDIISYKEPQNILFQWSPRHFNTSNTEYEFTLVEIWDSQVDPQTSFLASTPIYQTTTRNRILNYGIAEPALLEDRMYAWRVRAVVTDGFSEISTFKNDGYSEIYHFMHAGNCEKPLYILAEPLSANSAKIMWESSNHFQYQVQYRKKNGSNNNWYEKETYNEFLKLKNLEKGTTYEFRLGNQCIEATAYTYSQIYEFTTIASNKSSVYSCGITPEIKINNYKLLEELSINDTFIAGDFEVTVLSLHDSFSGEGYIEVPYLGDVKIAVEFSDIGINTDYQLIEGTVNTYYDKSAWNSFADENTLLDEIKETVKYVKTLGNEEIDEIVKTDAPPLLDENVDSNEVDVEGNEEQEEIASSLNGDEEIGSNEEEEVNEEAQESEEIMGPPHEEDNNTGSENEKFKLIDITVSDKKKPKRIAKSGETLYLLDTREIFNQKKELVYNSITDLEYVEAKHMEYNEPNFKWDFSSDSMADNLNEKSMTRTYKESTDVLTTNLKAGFPEITEKSVDVEWVEDTYSKISYMHKFDGLFKFLDVFHKVTEEINEKTKGKLPCELELGGPSFGANFNWDVIKFKSEDEDSRHIMEHNMFKFIINPVSFFRLNCRRGLTVRKFGREISLGVVGLHISLSGEAAIVSDKIYSYEGNEIMDNRLSSMVNFDLTGGISLTGGITREEKDEDVDATATLSYRVGAAITGVAGIVYPYQGEKNEILALTFLNPIVFDAAVNVKLGMYQKSFNYKKLLLSKRISGGVIYNMKLNEFRKANSTLQYR